MTLTSESDRTIARARSVVKRFGATTALADLSFDMAPGITGLLGSNGAGKTTLLELMLGLQPADDGELLVLGHDPGRAGPELRARVGYSPEHHNLPPDVQAADLVRHISQLHGLPAKAATERASDSLWQVGLGEERFRPIGTMSTGQRQRVKLAQALAHDPALMMLDEPTDGLDPVQRDDMLALIRRVGTEFGIDVILSSHLLEEVERICDNVVILADGVAVRAGRLDDLQGTVTGLVVEVDGGAEELAADLGRRGLTVELSSSRVLVSTTDDDAVMHDAVRDCIADLGLSLRRLTPRRHTLEDVYLEAAQ